MNPYNFSIHSANLRKIGYNWRKNDPGVSFLLIIHEEKWPRRKNYPCLKSWIMYIEKASQYFDFIRNRDLPNKQVDLGFIVVLIMCIATVFSMGTEGLYLSIFCESQQLVNTVLWYLARSHRSLDNSFHLWHILLFVNPFYVKMCLLEDLIQGHWLCRHPCDPKSHALVFISHYVSQEVFDFDSSIRPLTNKSFTPKKNHG